MIVRGSFMDAKDIEANVFACNLLMPRKMIQRLLDERPGITTARMAKVFQVSEADMTARLARSRFIHKQAKNHEAG